MRAWQYVIGCGFLAFALIAAGSMAKLGKFSTAFNVACFLGAVPFGLTAGVYLTETWVLTAVGALANLHPVVPLFLFGGSLILLWATLPNLIADKLKAVGTAVPIALTWILLPCLYQVGVFPGQFGDRLGETIALIAKPALDGSLGWFG